MPEDVEVSDEEPEEALIETELATWERYAIRNLGKKGGRQFSTEYLPTWIEDGIRAKLEQATTPEEVRSAFESSSFLDWQSYP